MNFLVDTNICSAYLKGDRNVWSKFMQYSGGLGISVITAGELWTWVSRTNASSRARKTVSDFIDLMDVVDIDLSISLRFGTLRGEMLPLPVDRLPPPDLVIRDELHLISGPLGTMVGLYETALDELATIEKDGKRIRPKIIASTATVRRAESQIRALFNRRNVDVFPPPGPDVRDSFFARAHSTDESNARQYLGIAAQGCSPKVIMLRVYLALLAAVQKAYREAGGKKAEHNPADPYMTLLGYFNSLRELGGARRLIEDEVRTQLTPVDSDDEWANRKDSFATARLPTKLWN